MTTIVVTGTDTDVGKTIFAAALTTALGAMYWKPIQAGLADGSDASTVASLGVPQRDILPEAYRLTTPCSPHRAAELDGIEINADLLTPLPMRETLVVEGAGGVLVPVTRRLLYADLFARWGHPVVIVARTELGTINHSLLSIEALRARAVPILGIAFIGDPNEDSEAIVVELGKVRHLGRLPRLTSLTATSLRAAFHANFRLEDFR
ncbi:MULTISPECIES: dethiobiotin synthase [Sphingosinicellaceae]|uniref:dethiobiotin synthase n=1 Tax=Sphingosinicellaceae TaxID=2820280 RepID=UPI001C1E8087|nr:MULTISPECIES: dethiobiotin synthase [Polymorphobacter]QYE35601.1 dethiobiotin synthase [Polymorphobacter sp. PAMC 29334]UAJ11032.1 dethiobiotin synthase [Polymorphobacter megasporae]